MELTNEQRLLKALKDIVEWYKTPDVPVSMGINLIGRAEALVREIEGA